MGKLTIFLDIDGVICDFVGGAEEVHGPAPRKDSWDIHEWYGLDPEEFWAPLSSREFWANLKALPDAFKIVEACHRYGEIVLCTTPTLSAECLAGKMDWIQRVFGGRFRDYIFTPRKGFLAKPGRVLVDDSDKNVKEFRSAGGHAVLWPQPWNANRGMENPLEHLIINLDFFSDR